MGMEVAGSTAPQVNGEAKTKVHGKENGKVNASEPIKFGSHGVEEQQTKVDGKNVANVPTNATDEWPDAPQIHSFYFVKYRPFEDPALKAKIEQVDKDIQKTNQRISQINEQLKPKRAARAEIKDELSSLVIENRGYGEVLNEKRQEMQPLRDALGTLRGSGGEYGICSTVEELDGLIRSLEYRMQHESMTLKEEKQLLKEIKDLEATRPKVIANTAKRAKIQDSMGKTEVIQDQVKLLGNDVDGVKKQRATLRARMDQLRQQLKAIEDQMDPLKKEYDTLDQKRKQAFDTIRELRNKRDEGNSCFYQNRNVLNSAKELAAKRDLKALEELVNEEVEKFMSQWNSSKAFRDNYEKRILMSLDMRQLSRDGRIRNPDEKPLVMPEVSKPQIEVAPKASHKPQKEEPKPTVGADNPPVQKGEKESKKNNKGSKMAPEQSVEEEEVFVVEKPKKKEIEIDEAKLKEMKREEEKEKQRQALERKKKQQEKAAAKAALRAQKEAEKKQKALEKKLKKKEGTSSLPSNEEDQSEQEADVAEHEKSDIVEEVAETSAPSSKPREQKDNSLRFRKSGKARASLPKAILKKKKYNYWYWGSGAAAAAVLLVLLVLGYKYFL